MAPLAPSKLKLSSKPKRPKISPKSPLNSSTHAHPSPLIAKPKPNPTKEDEPQDAEHEMQLHGFSSDEDSSDEEDDTNSPELPGIDVSKLPMVAKDDLAVKRRLEVAKKTPTQDRGVLYLARIPHGFYEAEMKAYFSQFGTVTRLRLSRNKKTGRSKHYGFIEFDSASVAQIVSETMDNYLLMGHILQCKLIPKDEVHPELWVGSNRKWRVVPRDRVHRVQHNKARTVDQQRRIEQKILRRQARRQAKIDSAGIGYNIGVAGYRTPVS